jgi:hypothetical protein
MAQVETSTWSGDGDFTKVLVEALSGLDDVALVRVEDSPASRSDTGFAFLSNEVYVGFAGRTESVRHRLLGFIPVTRALVVPALDLEGLAQRLADVESVGAPDVRDEGMLQYLKAERVAAPWQTKGIKVVEMVRVYALPFAAR